MGEVAVRLVAHDGVWWEAACQHNTPQGRTRRRQTALTAAFAIGDLVSQHRTVVQAGGWIGLWPQALAGLFDRVLTCEPAADNWEALQRNVTMPNVSAQHAALGATLGTVDVTRDRPASGMWRTVPGTTVPLTMVDAWNLSDMDALVLDLEGAELDALRGAEATLAATHPLVWLEWIHHTADIATWLHARGYRGPFPGVQRDVYFS